MKEDIKNSNLETITPYVEKHAQPSYRAQQILTWIYQKKIDTFSAMKNIPRSFIARLNEDFYVSEMITHSIRKSNDGTKKFLFGLEDARVIESVYIPHRDRTTLCLSTQVGCRYGCSFCASAQAGFERNLSQAEILNQVMAIAKSAPAHRISNIVFMGIGEPLDNYDNVLSAIHIITAPYGFAIGQRKITISSAGVIDGIRRLAGEGLQVELSVSLHSADEEKRSSIMPINKKYPLAQLMPALREYVTRTNRKITFEYMLLGGFNTAKADAAQLVKIIRGIHCSVNLIACNPVAHSLFFAPGAKEITFFKDYLLRHHCEVTVRRPRGQDIEAACGQLRLSHKKETEQSLL